LAVVDLLEPDLPRRPTGLQIHPCCCSNNELICYKCCVRLWAAWFDIARDGLVLVINILKVLMPCVADQQHIKIVARAAVANQGQLQAVDRQNSPSKEQFRRGAHNRVIPTLPDVKTKMELPLAVTICVCLRGPQRLAVSYCPTCGSRKP